MTTATASRRKRKQTRSAPPADAVTAYAQGVVDGSLIAGRAVRLAGQRHLNDLKRQRTEMFPFYFDVAAAQHVIDFFPEFLTLESGAPFVLPPWLQFCYGSLFGWKCWGGERHGKYKPIALSPELVARGGLRKYKDAFLETSKGSGKTPSGGGIGLYALVFDDEPYAEIYSTGFDEDQASIMLRDAVRMGEHSDALIDVLQIDKYNILHPDSGSFFRAMSSQHRSKSGPRPHMVLSDEVHEHRDGTVISKAESGFKNRLQPLGIKYTNSGSSTTSYCWELHKKSLDILEGITVDEQFFAYVCHLDPCEKCYREGLRQPKDGCPDCDDWTDPAVWPKIAPALGIVIQPKYLQDAIDTALSMPSEFNLKRRLNFCIWTQTHNVWISSDAYDLCQVEKVHDANPELLACAAGLDPSSTLDLTSLVVALMIEDPPSKEPAAQVEIEGLDEAGERLVMAFKLDFSIELVPYFWIPEATLHERVQKERIPYDVWAREKRLFMTKGPAIDHNAIYDFTLKTCKTFHVQKLGMDENQGRFLFIKLRDQGKLKDQIVSVGQGKKLSEAYKFIEILVAHCRLRHDGHPVLKWNFGNAEPHEDRLNAKWIEKPSATKRIDGAVASAMAIKELMALPRRKKKAFGMFFMGGS